MEPTLPEALAAERRKDLLTAAERQRLAAAAAPQPGMRLRVGRALVGAGLRISGCPQLVLRPLVCP